MDAMRDAAHGEGPARVVVELGPDGVAEVRLNRPDKLNALDAAMFAELVAAAARLAAEPSLRAVVLSGEGRAFCAGLDMAGFAAAGGSPLGGDLSARTHGRANLFQAAVLCWRDLPVPVVAAIHGSALGGGFQIALGADIRIVAPDAKLSAMEIRWGIVPDMGGILLMRELARADICRDLVYTGRVFSGEEAERLGFATRLGPDPRAEALAAAREIASRSPDAVRAAKRLLGIGDEALRDRVLLAESAEQAGLIGAPNQREAVAANFGKRPPRFRDAG